MWRLLTSLRTAALLLAALAVLLLLNVVVPQRTVLGEAAFAVLADKGGVQRFLLVGLGLGSMATSPLFLAVLALLFACLVSVLLERGRVTLRRVRVRVPSAEVLRQRATGAGTLRGPLPEEWSAETALGALKGLGYRRARVGRQAVWGVKHRFAPVGFLVFHVSFLLLLAGGVLLHLTRFVALVTVAEGQTFQGEGAQIVRRPAWGGAPRLELTLERAELRREDGQPVHLGARLRFSEGGRSVLKDASINHPARAGPTSILVERAGLAPVLWLQDERGFSIDRVAAAVPPSGADPIRVPLAEGRFEVELPAEGPRESWPTREQLAAVEVPVTVHEGESVVFSGALRPGEGVRVDDHWLALVEVRHWVGMRIVSERGSGLLLAGFVLGVAGLVWRLSWHRREIAILWDEGELVVSGRSELFHLKFRAELVGVAKLIAPGPWDETAASGPERPTG